MTTSLPVHRVRGAWGALVGCTALALSAAPPPPGDPAQRIEHLRRELARHDELYFKHAAPEISDAAYDALKRELQAWEARHPEIVRAGTEPGATLGDDRSGRFPTARHRAPMLGLEKSYTDADLNRFFDRAARSLGGRDVTWVIEPKYDGLAISVTYERGRLTRAVTRGDGTEGDVVTENLRSGVALPVQLTGANIPEVLELRGEVFVSRAEFDRLNQERMDAGDEPFAHPRNLAAGTLKSLDANERAGRRLSIVFFGWGAIEPAPARPRSQQEFLERLRNWQLPGPDARVVRGESAAREAIRTLGELRSRRPAPTDGAVVKLDEVALRDTLGASPTAPHWALAHKFEPERAKTRLRAITWQVGRTGVLTPVAELEPVTIGGATVARASLHNRKEIERGDYRLGDQVWVERAGEVVPQLAGVSRADRPPEARAATMPTSCPACGTALATSSSVTLRCPNRSCRAQIAKRLEHFVSAPAMNVRGVGPGTLAALVEAGIVDDVDSLYRVSPADWERFAGAGATEIQRELERSRRAPMSRVVVGLGLPGVGTGGARKLAARFPDLVRLRAASVPDVRQAGFSAGVAEQIAAEVARPSTQRVIDGLIAAGFAPTGP
jgi:DNA ligase (NAD+)